MPFSQYTDWATRRLRTYTSYQSRRERGINSFFKSYQQDHHYQMQITEMPTAILLLPGNVAPGIASNQRKCFPSPSTAEVAAI